MGIVLGEAVKSERFVVRFANNHRDCFGSQEIGYVKNEAHYKEGMSIRVE